MFTLARMFPDDFIFLAGTWFALVPFHHLFLNFCMHGLMAFMHFPISCMDVWSIFVRACEYIMAFFEQAAVLSTAWANRNELATNGAQNSLNVITSKKLTRGVLRVALRKLCGFIACSLR